VRASEQTGNRLSQGMVRKRIGVRALSVELFLRKRRIIICEVLLVLFALLALRWFAGHAGVL
jgi:hypothetical protein